MNNHVQFRQERHPRRWVLERHREVLLISIAVIVGSFALAVRTDQRVSIRGFSGIALPELCPLKKYVGMRCPGCGLTRSFIHLARGDWRASLAVQPVGWLLAAATLLQIPYRGVALWKHREDPLGTILPKLTSLALIVALLVNWIIWLILGRIMT